MDRRSFLKTVSLVCATLPASALARGNQQVLPTQIQDNNLIVFSNGYFLFEHRHFISIPGSVLEEPPYEGFQVRTSSALAHSHVVRLTQSQLRKIAQGQVVEVVDSTVAEHTFVIYIPS